MSDFIRPIDTQALNAILDRFALKTYNGLGLNSTGGTASGGSRNIVVDQVSLSSAARQIFATSGSYFPARAAGVGAVASQSSRFDSVDLSGASFVGQILDGAVFNNSILKDVNFVGASLRGAIFSASLVEGARFNQADLSGANLSGAQGLAISQVQGSITDGATVFPAGIGNAINGTFGATGGTPFNAQEN
jgi:uncharacterized protein YjbI with pentapeptide repeats